MKHLRQYIRQILLESSMDPGLMSYLQDLAFKAESGDLKGAVSGLVFGSYSKAARQYVFDECQIINWNEYPELKASGVQSVIPRKMPGMWGMAGAAAKVTGWLMKNRSNQVFKSELKSVVRDTLAKHNRMIA